MLAINCSNPQNHEVVCEAVKILEMGLWPVVLDQGTKRPFVRGWGRKRNSIEKIQALVRQRSGCGLGICLGPRSRA